MSENTAWQRHNALAVLRMLRPRRLVGAEKIRVGRLFDGGYVMLDRFDDVVAAYSLGINDDVTWDMDMARRGIPIFQYDHTIDHLPEDHPLFCWEKKGIASHPGERADLATLESLMNLNSHQDQRDLILKCDIEGSEWQVFRHTPASIIRQFRQIVIEIHYMDYLKTWPDAENVRSTIANMTAYHHVVHVHGNNYGEICVVGGVALPSTLELTLVRKDEGVFELSDEVFPTSLDMPCNGLAADFYLGRFEFP